MIHSGDYHGNYRGIKPAKYLSLTGMVSDLSNSTTTDRMLIVFVLLFLLLGCSNFAL